MSMFKLPTIDIRARSNLCCHKAIIELGTRLATLDYILHIMCIIQCGACMYA